MAELRFDVVAIGNALVDVIAQVDDEFLRVNALEKGAMTLVDAERARELYERMPPAIEISGGSAGNTIVGVAALGGRAAYIGKVNGDELGRVFAHDIRAAGVAFEARPVRRGVPTGRCLIAVTGDAQRTMSTYLGIANELGPEDVDEGVVSAAAVTYLEGYLWDPPRAKDAFRKAAGIAHEAGRRVSMTLSDAYCVERHRADFLEMVRGSIDVLFANASEITSLYEASSFDDALQLVRGHCEIAVLTRSEKGAVIVAGEEVHVVEAEPADVVDTTGAGDLYAAGFLYGLTQGRDLRTCGRIGAIAAAEVISHYGARPETPLRALVRQRLGS